MGTKIRRRRIRRAFRAYEGSENSREPDGERGIGKLPKKSIKPRPMHPLEAKLYQDGAMILKALSKKGGFLPLGDHSPPEAILAEFPFSKRVFKKTVGYLWKHRKIEIVPREGIRLVKKESSPQRSERANTKSNSFKPFSNRPFRKK